MAPPTETSTGYIGRFAPSPSGPLHFGSLVCAVASYLHAKTHHGKWLIRMEDIDPPREQPGAKQTILNSLSAHGLHSDAPVLYQSTRTEAYQATLNVLQRQGLTYPCNCTRKRIHQLPSGYDGHCLRSPPPPNSACAIRLDTTNVDSHGFEDALQGHIECTTLSDQDFILVRKDGLFAYQLAVVIDDHFQNITHVVRGIDLLETTGNQIALYKTLGYAIPKFAHLPVVVDHNGDKLSKQTHAPAIDDQRARKNVIDSFAFLSLPTPPSLLHLPLEKILEFGVEHFDIQVLRQMPTHKTFKSPTL